MARSFGLELIKTTYNFGWDFGSNKGSGVDLNYDAHAGWGVYGGTVTLQNLMSKDSLPYPTSFEGNYGPQFGASISPELEGTVSVRDIVNIIGDLFSLSSATNANPQTNIKSIGDPGELLR